MIFAQGMERKTDEGGGGTNRIWNHIKYELIYISSSITFNLKSKETGKKGKCYERWNWQTKVSFFSITFVTGRIVY